MSRVTMSQRILELHASGRTNAEIAEAVDRSQGYVGSILTINGLKCHKQERIPGQWGGRRDGAGRPKKVSDEGARPS